MSPEEKKKKLLKAIEVEDGIKFIWKLTHAWELNFDKKKHSFYELTWSPRENSGDPRIYLTLEQAWDLVMKNKPEVLSDNKS